MAIRPEDVLIGEGVVRGRVEIVEYLGREQEAAIRLDDGMRVWLRTATHMPGRGIPSVSAFPSTRSCCCRTNDRGPDARCNTPRRSEFDVFAMVCILPSLLYVLCMFVYPFLYGLYLSLRPPKIAGFSLANYFAFFSDPYQYGTIWITFSLAVPCTIIVLLLSLVLAYGMRRGFFMERTVTTS